jgi:plasmid maintenance system antidote protein VapI
MASTVFDWNDEMWKNLQRQATLLKDLIAEKESPRSLTSIERTKLRLIISTISDFKS